MITTRAPDGANKDRNKVGNSFLTFSRGKLTMKKQQQDRDNTEKMQKCFARTLP